MRSRVAKVWKDSGRRSTGASRLTPKALDPLPKFDVTNHVAEVLAGVAQANNEFDGNLEVEAVEIVPDDYPSKFQAQHVAYKIAYAVISGQI